MVLGFSKGDKGQRQLPWLRSDCRISEAQRGQQQPTSKQVTRGHMKSALMLKYLPRLLVIAGVVNFAWTAGVAGDRSNIGSNDSLTRLSAPIGGGACNTDGGSYGVVSSSG